MYLASTVFFGAAGLAIIAATSLAVAEERAFRLLKLDGTLVKWGQPTLGSGAAITFAFVRRELRFSDARNCGHLKRLADHAAAIGISIAQIETQFLLALKAWERAADVKFERASDAKLAELLVGAQGEPSGRAFANVWRRTGSPTLSAASRGLGNKAARSPSSHAAVPILPMQRALICINTSQPRKLGFDGNHNVYDLRFTFMHEIVYTLGLDHPSRKDQLMHFRYDETRIGLQAGDIAGAVKLYGIRGEKSPAPLDAITTNNRAENSID